MATSQRSRQVQRMYGPIRLDNLDPEAQRQMYKLTRSTTEFGALVADLEKGHHIASLAEGIAKELIEGTAREGLVMKKVCEGRTGISRIGDRMVPSPLRIAVDIGVRSLLLRFGFEAIHEHVTSIPVKPGKDSHGFGIDQLPRMSRMGHLLLSAVGSDDRSLLTMACWLPTGTEDDHTSARANPQRIAGWREELEREVAGSLRENLAELFEVQKQARMAALKAAAHGAEAFAAIGLDPREFLRSCFPRCLILDILAYGPPEKQLASSAAVIHPGDDDQIIAVVERAGRHGIARCEVEEKLEIDDVEASLLPELRERFGEEPEPVAQSVLDSVADWETAYNLGIGPGVRAIRYWHFKRSGYLFRAEQVSGRQAAVNLWRMVKLDNTLLREAVSLVERAQQPWPESCIERFVEECAPGLMSMPSAR